MPDISLADITTWMAAAGLLAPLAGIGRQFSAPGGISHAPRRRLNARSRTPDPAFTPRTLRLGAVGESSRPSDGTAVRAHLLVDGGNSPIGARCADRLAMRWQHDRDGALVMSLTLGAP